MVLCGPLFPGESECCHEEPTALVSHGLVEPSRAPDLAPNRVRPTKTIAAEGSQIHRSSLHITRRPHSLKNSWIVTGENAIGRQGRAMRIGPGSENVRMRGNTIEFSKRYQLEIPQ